MLLQTRHFGEIAINEDDVITFDEGIPGFETVKRYIILGNEDAESPFRWLQSIDQPEYAFVVVDPFRVVAGYAVDVDDQETDGLQIESPEDVAVYCIVVVPEDITKMTANLKAPLLINVKKKKGRQVILDNSSYSVRHYVLEQQRVQEPRGQE